MEKILEELKKINHTLEIHGRMLTTLIEAESQRTHNAQAARMDVAGHVNGVFSMLRNNPMFKDNPDLLNMFEGFNSTLNKTSRDGEEKS